MCVYVVMQALPLVPTPSSAPDFGPAAAAWTARAQASGAAPSMFGSGVFGLHLSSQVGPICLASVRKFTYTHCILIWPPSQ